MFHRILLLAAFPLLAGQSMAEEASGPAPGLSLQAVYKADALRNTTGGIAIGQAYLDNFDLEADLAGHRLFGLADVSAHAHLMYDNGHEFGARYSGESQLVSNIEGVHSWRLYEVWVEYAAGSNSRSARIGLYDLNSEFDVLDAAGLFLNSSHGISPTTAQSGLNGPSIFPNTSLAVRYHAGDDHGYWQTVALDGVPGDPAHPERTGVHLSRREGALLVGEVGGAPLGFSKLAAGAWRYTADFVALTETDANGVPLRGAGNQGWYLIGERPLAGNDRSGARVFLRLGGAAGRFNPLTQYVGGGVVLQGIWERRPEDQFGLSLASASNSSQYRAFSLAGGLPLDGTETVTELTWRAPINRWLVLQPDAQYIANPGMVSSFADSLVLGLRFELSANWSK